MRIELTGKRLRELLEDLDITNVEAAEMAGCSQSSMYRWLNDEAPIPRSVIAMFEAFRHIQRGQELIRVSWSEPEP